MNELAIILIANTVVCFQSSISEINVVTLLYKFHKRDKYEVNVGQEATPTRHTHAYS